MRVATHDRHAGERRTVLRANHVHDPLPLRHEGKVGRRTKGRHIGVQCDDLFFGDGVRDPVVAFFPTGRWGVVVSRCHDRAGTPQGSVCLSQALKRLGAGDLVHQVAINVEDRRAVLLRVYNVFIPNFVVKRTLHG